MELIYAFMDESGEWHGEPDLAAEGSAPREDILAYHPLSGMEGALSRFAGQRLRVRHADIGGKPGPVPYQVEGRGSYLPTWIVYELLTEPSETRATSIPQPRRPSTLEEGDWSAPYPHGS